MVILLSCSPARLETRPLLSGGSRITTRTSSSASVVARSLSPPPPSPPPPAARRPPLAAVRPKPSSSARPRVRREGVHLLRGELRAEAAEHGPPAALPPHDNLRHCLRAKVAQRLFDLLVLHLSGECIFLVRRRKLVASPEKQSAADSPGAHSQHLLSHEEATAGRVSRGDRARGAAWRDAALARSCESALRGGRKSAARLRRVLLLDARRDGRPGRRVPVAVAVASLVRAEVPLRAEEDALDPRRLRQLVDLHAPPRRGEEGGASEHHHQPRLKAPLALQCSQRRRLVQRRTSEGRAPACG